jgi:SAM-dependent methyltransferase
MTMSVLRKEEYKMLSKLTLTGKVIDIGGSKRSGYHQLLKGDHEIITANIEESYGTDLIFDAEKVWPLENESFDTVLLINVLEHLYDHRVALQESARVLKSSGRIIGVVPFMYNVHGSPNDYFRYTKSALARLLSEVGFTRIEISELGTGAFSVLHHCIFGPIRWPWLAYLTSAACRTLDMALIKIKPDNKMSKEYMPLGYYFEAVKK